MVSLTLAAAGLVLLGAKLSVRSVATGQAIVPIAGAPALGPANTPHRHPAAGRASCGVRPAGAAGPEAVVEVVDRFNAVAGQQETGTSGEAVLGVKPDPGYVVTARKPGWPLGRIEGTRSPLPLVGPAPRRGPGRPRCRAGAGGAGADGGPGGAPAGSAPAPAAAIAARRGARLSSWGTTPPA